MDAFVNDDSLLVFFLDRVCARVQCSACKRSGLKVQQ